MPVTAEDVAELEAFIDKAYRHDFRLRMTPEIAAIVSLLLEERGRGKVVPQRIQRKRIKSWRMPSNAVYVGRPTIFGNPASAEVLGSKEAARDAYVEYLRTFPAIAEHAKSVLRGKHLACWCKIGEPCHADVLLEVANI